MSSAVSALDLGCGPFGLALANESWRLDLTAVDPLLDLYAQHVPNFDKADYPQTRFVTSTIEAYKPGSVADLVFSMNAVNHVMDIHAAYDVVVNSCRPGGTVVVSVDAHNFTFFKHVFRWLPFDVLHPHQHDLAEYRAFLVQRGCRILREVTMKHEFFFDHVVMVAVREK